MNYQRDLIGKSGDTLEILRRDAIKIYLPEVFRLSECLEFHVCNYCNQNADAIKTTFSCSVLQISLKFDVKK